MPELLREGDDFIIVRVDSNSLNGGYHGIKGDDKYFCKPAFLKTKDATGLEFRGQRRELVAEYLSASIFNELLGDRAPEIGLVLGSDEKTVYLSSKIFKKFKTLSELSPIQKEGLTELDPTRCKPDNTILKEVTGFEKVIAACLVAGELDIHAGNIGVVLSGDQGYEAVKIDHGKSGIENPETESKLRKNLTNDFAEIGYGGMDFDVSKFREEVSRVCSVEDKIIRARVESRISDLKSAGLEASSINAHGEKETFGVMFDPTTKPKPIVRPKRTFNSPSQVAAPAEPEPPISPEEKARIENGAYDKIRDFYVDGFSDRKKVLKDLERTLGIIEKIDMPDEWKKGTWLQEIKGQDPVEWAIVNGRTIQGKPASEWLSSRESAASKIQKAFKAHTARRVCTPQVISIAKKDTTSLDR